MRKILVSVMGFLISAFLNAQQIAGEWSGTLNTQGIGLRVVFHINKIDSAYISTMDSPDQGVEGIPVTKTIFKNGKLELQILNPKVKYSGQLNGNQITGSLTQSGDAYILKLSRVPEAQTVEKAKEASTALPYYSEDVTFQNENANITLAGTLTLPLGKGPFPVLILITGSGPQDRNEEIMGHKPFLVISDYLTRNGIGVFRYDDRGVAKSTGDFERANTFDFVSDVESAITYLKTRKEANIYKIGLLGHSEGGSVATLVASKNPDIDFMILLAAPGIPGYKLMLLQKQKIETAMHFNQKVITHGQQIFTEAYQTILESSENDANLKNKIKICFQKNLPGVSEEQANLITDELVNPWMICFLKYDPAAALEKVKCPVLAIGGEKDLQVPSEENLSAIQAALEKGGNKNFTVKSLLNLNHLFQNCKTGLPNEYSNMSEKFSKNALNEITTWIKDQTK